MNSSQSVFDGSFPVSDLLPQRPPFVMVDRLVHFDWVVTRTVFRVLPENIFVDDGVFSVAGLLENVAQTCAVRMGYISRQSDGLIKVGVIGALRNMAVGVCPLVGDCLVTTIEVVEEAFGMVLAHARVDIEGADSSDPCLEGEIKIALTDQVADN